MRILIIGNLGYIGPVLSKYLHQKDFVDIDGIDTCYFAHCLSVNDHYPDRFIKNQKIKDVREVNSFDLEEYDTIIYLAAISNDPMGNTFSEQTYDINYHSTIDIAKKAKNNGIKNFIYASSCSVYGATDGKRNEASPINPLTTYAKSKILSEEHLEKLSDNNFIVTCLRFATACGWSPRLRLDLVLNDFVASAFVNNEIIIMSDGKPWRPLINVNDMACSIEWAMNRKINPHFLSINVGSNEWNYKIIDLAMAVKKLIPKANIHVNENAAPDKRSYQVDFSEYEKLAPLHQPKYNLEKTVDEVIMGLENIIFSDKNYRTSSYWIRLKTVNQLIKKGFINNQLYWK